MDVRTVDPGLAHGDRDAEGVTSLSRALWKGMGENVLRAVALTAGLAGLLAAGVLAVLDRLPAFEDAFLGAGIGVFAAKLIFAYAERHNEELSEIRRRRLEARWILAGTVFGAALYAIVEVV